MKNQPINNHNDVNYTINYNKEAEETFRKYFENKHEVLFLNGKWGSGKTSFLNIVFEGKKRFKLKFVDLWRVTSNQRTSEIIYKRMFPVSYWVIKYFFMILFVLFSGLALFLAKNNSFQWTFALFLSGFLSGLNQIIGKIDYDNIFLTFLKYRSKRRFLIKKRIIVIDDFDRIDYEKQMELYKIFNLLSNPKIQFVFLGDYSRIINSETTYLQKIIDRRIELPYSVSSSNIWNYYIESLISKINETRSIELKKIEEKNILWLKKVLISENRVLREKEIFEDYIKEMLLENERYDQVNFDQQLVIIYLYLFNPEKYNNLVNNIDNILNLKPDLSLSINLFNNKPEEIEKSLKDTKEIFNSLIGFDAKNERVVELNKLIWEVLLGYIKLENHTVDPTENQYIFDDFEKKFPNYLINYIPSNLTGSELKKLLNGDISVEDFRREISEDKDFEIYNFIRRNQNNLSAEELNKLLVLSIGLFKMGYDNGHIVSDEKSRISMIISLSTSIYINPLVSEVEIRHEKFENEYLGELELSQKLRLYRNYLGIPIPKLRDEYYKECVETLNNSSLLEYMYPEYVISLIFEKIDDIDSDSIEKILKFSDNNFFDFIYIFSKYSYTRDIAEIYIEEEDIKRVIKKRVSELDEQYRTRIDIN